MAVRGGPRFGAVPPKGGPGLGGLGGGGNRIGGGLGPTPNPSPIANQAPKGGGDPKPGKKGSGGGGMKQKLNRALAKNRK